MDVLVFFDCSRVIISFNDPHISEVFNSISLIIYLGRRGLGKMYPREVCASFIPSRLVRLVGSISKRTRENFRMQAYLIQPTKKS